MSVTVKGGPNHGFIHKRAEELGVPLDELMHELFSTTASASISLIEMQAESTGVLEDRLSVDLETQDYDVVLTVVFTPKKAVVN